MQFPRVLFLYIQAINIFIFLDFLPTSSFIPAQNVVYFLMLPFLVYNIYTFYINGVLNCKCPVGRVYRYSPEYPFYIFNQQIYLIIFLDFLLPSSSIPPQDVVYLLMLPFLVHNTFTVYINGVLNCKCPVGQAYRYSPEYTFYIFSQQIYLIIFLDFFHHLRLFLHKMSWIS